MTINRRQFVGLSLFSAGLLSAGISGWFAATHRPQFLLVSGYRDKTSQSQFGILVSDTSGQIVSDFPVPDRVHMSDFVPAYAPGPTPAIIVNSRAYQAPLQKYDLNGRLLAELAPPADSHFEGHIVFSEDSRFIYATTSNYEEQTGYVLEINATDLTLVRRFSSGGIGPHELVIRDNQLYVANTGVLTHPDSGRDPLNIDTMQSELVQIDIHSGDIRWRWASPIQALSARHISLMADGSILVGCQYQKNDDRPASVAIAKPGEKQLEPLSPEQEQLHWDMQGYTASVEAFGKESALAGQAFISNPRGHLLSHWTPDSDRKPLAKNMTYSKGIVLADDQAWISAGAGELWHWQPGQELKQIQSSIKSDFWWENHMNGRMI